MTLNRVFVPPGLKKIVFISARAIHPQTGAEVPAESGAIFDLFFSSAIEIELNEIAKYFAKLSRI
ncbi:hypothetical protein [Microcoleus sp.]|uniref:hypothetical protein n=1 Tax=Microcoleus sp. TaxID=44472 RepID=UPI00403E3ED1